VCVVIDIDAEETLKFYLRVLGVGTTHEGYLMVFITVQNLVGVDAVVLIICTFFDFESLA